MSILDNYYGEGKSIRDKIEELEEENRKLKSDLAYESTMLDNVKAEYENLQEINRKLKEDIEIINKLECVDLEVASERIKQLEEQLDNKEKLNKSYREEIDKLKIDLKLYENAYGHMFE